MLGLVKALATLDPSGFGLDDACAQLEGSTYVMAEEALLFSVLTRAAGSRIVKISSVPSCTPPQSARRGALQPTPLELRFSSFNNQVD